MFLNLFVALIVPACEARMRQSSLAAMVSAVLFMLGGAERQSHAYLDSITYESHKDQQEHHITHVIYIARYIYYI